MNCCKKNNRSATKAALCSAIGIGASLSVSAAALPLNVQGAMAEALADERKALKTYEYIMAEHGEVRPFVNIAKAEERHISALLGLYQKYDVPVPDSDIVLDKDSLKVDLKTLCEIGVEAEIENTRLYDEELLPAVSAYPDIHMVMTNLRNASWERHKPAFERCATGGGGKGKGKGKGGQGKRWN